MALRRGPLLLGALTAGDAASPPVLLSRLHTQLVRMLNGDGASALGGASQAAATAGAAHAAASHLRDGASADGAPTTDAAPSSGAESPRVRGQKDAQGLPVKDPRTVALLVSKGVGTPDAVQDLLRSSGTFKSTTYRYESCAQVYAVLEELVVPPGVSVLRNGQRMPLVASMVARQPSLLHASPQSLAAKWDALRRDPASGGLGFTQQQALKLVRGHPGVLKKRMDAVRQRLEWLAAQGLREPRAVLARQPTVLALALETLDAKAAVLRSYGLDVPAIVTAMPPTLALSTATLDAKARLLRVLLGASAEEVNGRGNLFGLDVRQRMRTRVFLMAQVHPAGQLPPPGLALTRMRQEQGEFLRALAKAGAPKKLCTPAGYADHVRSPEFQTFADELEQRLEAQAASAQR